MFYAFLRGKEFRLPLRALCGSVVTPTTKLVVSAVKGDPAETAKGELYEAMGFVRESERKSGLTRKKADAVVTKA